MINIIFLILLLFAGCASTPKPPETKPPKVKNGISGHKFWFVGEANEANNK